MTRKEYREALETLGITITGAAKVVGISARQAQRYAQGDTPVPGPLAKLLRIALARRITADKLAAL